jgi:hypothetical protein
MRCKSLKNILAEDSYFVKGKMKKKKGKNEKNIAFSIRVRGS